MSAQEITIHEVQGDRVKVVLRFLAECVRETGEAVKRRIDMRIVSFWRSTCDVLICFGLACHALVNHCRVVT